MSKIKILDLFAGTRSISRVFEKAGHETFSIDWDERHQNIDWQTDILKVSPDDILKRFGKPDVIWASPDCTTYSIAAISHHRIKDEEGFLLPKSDKALVSDKVLEHVIYLIKELKPEYFFIENPRGGMRKTRFLKDFKRYTVTYCQYGDTRMKPTDLWTNHPDPKFKKMCKNGDSCHVSAPRGSRTGTQGLKNAIERSVIPKELCEHILNITEELDV